MRQTVLSLLVIALVGVLLFLNYAAPIFSKSLIDINQVQGVDVYHKGVPFTLNLAQQTALGALIDNSISVQSLPSLQETPFDVEKVMFYLLKEQKPLVLIPKGENSVHFTYFSFDGKLYKEPQPGRLKELLEATYDH